MRWFWPCLFVIGLYAEESSTIHQGFPRESGQQAVIQATTQLFQEMAEDGCVPECVKHINRRFREAYPEPTPVQLNLDPGTGLVSINLEGSGQFPLVPDRRRRFDDKGNGGSRGNGRTPGTPEPPPGPMVAIIIILTVAFWAVFIWWLINRW
jgi:hypothetical protein